MNKRFLSLLALLLALLFSLSSCIVQDLYTGEVTFPPQGSDSGDLSRPEQPPTVGESFEVHFIDVGQADAALILCDGKSMLIDGGNVADSDVIYTYLKKHNITYLDYVVCSHAHEDHVGGLSGALTAADAGKVLAPVTSYDSKAFRNFASLATEKGGGIVIPNAGETFMLGSATVTVLGPIRTYDDTNDTSIVLRIQYGSTSFLFTGDMESTAEKDLLDAGIDLHADVLKLGHHGSSTSTSYRFLREVAPTYGIISAGTDNQYGHPHEEVLSRLRDAEVTLFRTDLQGDILCISDGTDLTFQPQRNANIQTNPTVK